MKWYEKWNGPTIGGNGGRLERKAGWKGKMERKKDGEGEEKKGNKSQVGKRNVTRKEGGKDGGVKNMKKDPRKRKDMNQIYIMPCESQKSSAPHFIYLRRLFGRQFLNPSSIMYVRSLVTLNQE